MDGSIILWSIMCTFTANSRLPSVDNSVVVSINCGRGLATSVIDI
jgi:hypothetical protein